MASAASNPLTSSIAEMLPPSGRALYESDGDDSNEEPGPGALGEESCLGSPAAKEEASPAAQPTPTDRYGFYLDSRRESVQLPAKELARRQAKEATREVKWAKMRNNWEKYATKKKAKLKRRIRKGIPDKLRGEVWDTLGRVPLLKHEHAAGRYAQLCRAANNAARDDPENSTQDMIERDLGRTFPRHSMFATGASHCEGGSCCSDGPPSNGAATCLEGEGLLEPLGLARLRRVLRAYAEYDPEVGYCQGMSFITAMFLVYRPPPPEAVVAHRAASLGCAREGAAFERAEKAQTRGGGEEDGAWAARALFGGESEARQTETRPEASTIIQPLDGAASAGDGARTCGRHQEVRDGARVSSASTTKKALELAEGPAKVGPARGATESRDRVLGEGRAFDEGEERAFWQLVAVMWRPGAGLRDGFKQGLAKVQVNLFVFSKLLANKLPALHRHFESEGVSVSMFATPWYMTIFSNSFPFDFVTRVWDVFMAEGFKVTAHAAAASLGFFGLN